MKPQQKFLALLLPLLFLLIWSAWVMIDSMDSDDMWRIVLSTLGFVIFTVLTILLIKSNNKKVGGEKRNQDDK